MSTVRLWDPNMQLLGTEHNATINIDPATDLAKEIELKFTGDGPIHEAIRTAPWALDMHITVDETFIGDDPRPQRIGIRVTMISIDEHDCECGTTRITTTTIRGTSAAGQGIGPVPCAASL